MKAETMPGRGPVLSTADLLRSLLLFALLITAAGEAVAQAPASAPNPADPRVGLKAGWKDPGEAILNLEHVAHVPRPEGFYDPSDPGNFGFMNSDLAFKDDFVFVGNFSGVQVWDISDATNPKLRLALVCPGGQGDVSVHGNLLFMSVEEMRGRLDCGSEGVIDTVSAERFRGVRIFDISDIDHPKQVAAVQTCRGSHTHTLVPDPNDDEHVYIYVSGTSQVRPDAELEGCSALPPDVDPQTSLFRIEVIKVPLAAPHQARIVNMPRIFADPATGNIAGLWAGGDHGEGTQQTYVTNQCHDITVYPEIGLAAGACSGNGILLDISDPENPKRIDEVIDPNFAYWHSATFSNDGTKVLFSDEWGGGVAPRCRETDRPEWGADAIFTLEDRKLRHAGYYKIPAPQTDEENCVAHNGSLIPVPGRDIMVQAWYQGGISVFDFTDPENPVEIAYFDRGPMDASRLTMGGYWSAYWYNGYIYASEIGRGLDVFALTPSEHLSQAEIDAAKLVRFDEANLQNQTKLVWPASFEVARAYLDQLKRTNGIRPDLATRVDTELQRAQRLAAETRKEAAADRLTGMAEQVEDDARAPGQYGDEDGLLRLASSLQDLAATLR